jgi:hypothetical protein
LYSAFGTKIPTERTVDDLHKRTPIWLSAGKGQVMAVTSTVDGGRVLVAVVLGSASPP